MTIDPRTEAILRQNPSPRLRDLSTANLGALQREMEKYPEFRAATVNPVSANPQALCGPLH